jgi:hypothetical protein
MHLSNVCRFGDPTPSFDELNTWRLGTFPPVSAISARPAGAGEHDQHVMEMNEVRHRASEPVQRGLRKFVYMISEADHPAGDLAIPWNRRHTMFKTISAALLAVSVIAAPAFAASVDKTTQGKTAPVTTTAQAPVAKTSADKASSDKTLGAKTAAAPVIKSEQSKSKLLNANARMGHHKHYRHYSRHHHKHMGKLKTHAAPKIATKHITSVAKRG